MSSESKLEDKPQDSKHASHSIIDKVANHFFEDKAFENIFEAWVAENILVIDLDSEEHKLEYTTLHNEFKATYEEKLEAYIHRNGSTSLDFFEEVKKAQDRDLGCVDALQGAMILAATDFDVFMTLLREARSEMGPRK